MDLIHFIAPNRKYDLAVQPNLITRYSERGNRISGAKVKNGHETTDSTEGKMSQIKKMTPLNIEEIWKAKNIHI